MLTVIELIQRLDFLFSNVYGEVLTGSFCGLKSKIVKLIILFKNTYSMYSVKTCVLFEL